MPRKNYKRKSYTKRRSSRRRYSSNTLSTYKPFTARKLFHTRYIEQGISLNPSLLGGPATYIFSANGLYDPNISGQGHQPIGFDQLVGVMYDHYTVVGTKIRVTFTNTDNSNTAIVGIMAVDNATALTNISRTLENGNVKWTSLARSGSGGSTKILAAQINPAKFLGRPNPLSEDNLRGDDSSNPIEQCYFHIFSAPSDVLSDLSAVQCLVQIEYTAILTEPKKLALS